jgi:hypothetical protein
MQKAEPSTSVTIPSAPMLALALVVQGSGIARSYYRDSRALNPGRA